MLIATASAISASFCGVLNTQRVLGSVGLMIAADAASEIIGVLVSAATSRIASELGVVDEPMITSTLSSVTSLRAFVTAFVVSDASSSRIHLTFSPPIDAGSSSIVFFCGMPSEAAGPVADTVMPTVTSASAGTASANAIAAPSAVTDFGWFMHFLLEIVGAEGRFPAAAASWSAAVGATRVRFCQSRPCGSIEPCPGRRATADRCLAQNASPSASQPRAGIAARTVPSVAMRRSTPAARRDALLLEQVADLAQQHDVLGRRRGRRRRRRRLELRLRLR